MVQGGHIVLNEDCANILKQFNLGESTLTPVQIYWLSTGELWLEDTFYFLNLCEQREFVTHPQSDENYEYCEIQNVYDCFDATNDTLEIQQSAQQCDVDLWHDPIFSESFFMSDALHNALVEANMHEKWNPHFCKLV